MVFDRLAYAVSYFDITQNNIPRLDPNILPSSPNPFGQIPGGRETARGVDLDVEVAVARRADRAVVPPDLHVRLGDDRLLTLVVRLVGQGGDHEPRQLLL